MSINIVPPIIRQEDLNHQTLSSDNIIFMPGQFNPQNSVTVAKSAMAVAECLDDSFNGCVGMIET
jgi:hypothetical protein